jgi:hypothetical protein
VDTLATDEPLDEDDPDLSASRLRVSADRRNHILGGDRTGGGHRFGAGRGKSEFPQNWSDQDIIDAIEDLANDHRAPRSLTRTGGILLTGERNGVRVTVVIDRAGQIITGYPR